MDIHQARSQDTCRAELRDFSAAAARPRAAFAAARKIRACSARQARFSLLSQANPRWQGLASSLQRPNRAMSGQPRTRAQGVLLVDGDVRSSHRLAELLREDGFDVEVLRDGASAINRLSCAPMPGTLITELALPSTDGETIARFARSRDPSVRVVVLTRHPHLMVPERFVGASPVVLTKPLDYAQLLEVLRGPGSLERGSSIPASRGN